VTRIQKRERKRRNALLGTESAERSARHFKHDVDGTAGHRSVAIQSLPIASLLAVAIVTAILCAVFLAMMPKDPPATDPANALAFLSQFDQDFGRPVFLFGLFEIWGGQIVAALSVWDAPPSAEDFAVLAAILWDMFVFFVDAIAEGTEGRSAAHVRSEPLA